MLSVLYIISSVSCPGAVLSLCDSSGWLSGYLNEFLGGRKMCISPYTILYLQEYLCNKIPRVLITIIDLTFGVYNSIHGSMAARVMLACVVHHVTYVFLLLIFTALSHRNDVTMRTLSRMFK